jgi:teichuronic acid biosynthesis glycosyltransferase TuaH
VFETNNSEELFLLGRYRQHLQLVICHDSGHLRRFRKFARAPCVAWSMLDTTVLSAGRRARGRGTRDVVFVFSSVSWQAAARRGWFMSEDRLARSLVGQRDLRRVLVGDLMRSLPVKIARELLAPERERVEFPAGERAQLLQPLRLRLQDPTSLRGVARFAAAYDRALARAVVRMGLHEPAAIVVHPLLAGFADLSWARAVTYYAIDDWAAHPQHRRWWPAYRESFACLRLRRRRVAAVSSALLERLAPSGPCATIPNGVEPSEWIGDPTPPGWQRDMLRPLLLYIGTLDARLDVSALLSIARALPEATLVLAGALLDPGHLRPLRAEPNVEIHPALDRAGVTGLVRVADVGLVPHVRSPLTEAMSPLKLYEYLAGGLPVVAADLPALRGIDPRVVLVDGSQGYPAAVERALAIGPAPEDERLTFVQTNSWNARHDCLLNLALA